MDKQAKAAQEKTARLEEQSQEQPEEKILEEQLEEVVGGRHVPKAYLRQLDNQTITQPESSDDFNDGPPRNDVHY